MNHKLSFPKNALEFPKIRLEIGVDTSGNVYSGFFASGLPPDGASERVACPEPTENE